MHDVTDPSPLMMTPGDESSGLWLWHGAPPDEPKQDKASARRVRWLVIGGVLLLAALLLLAWFVVTLPKRPSPAEVTVSSPVTPAPDPPSSPPVEAVLPPPVAAVQPRDPSLEPVQRDNPATAIEMKQTPMSAPATPLPSQASPPVRAKPSVARHHRDQRERARTPLTQLFMSPAFRKGTLTPVRDH